MNILKKDERLDSLHELAFEVTLQDLETPKFRKEFAFQVQGIPIDVFISTNIEPGWLTCGMRLGLGFIGGVTEMRTQWSLCVLHHNKNESNLEAPDWTEQTFKRPVVRKDTNADKWSPWKGIKNAFEIGDVQKYADAQGRLKLAWYVEKFDSVPDDSVLIRLIFDQMFRSSDQNLILNQTTSLKDALDTISTMRKRNMELMTKVDQLNKQSKFNEQALRKLQADSQILTASKKRKLEECGEDVSASLAGVPKSNAQLEQILLSMQDDVIPTLDEEELRKIADTVNKFHNAVTQACIKSKECTICCEEIKQKVCLVGCGHTSICQDCAASLIAQSAPAKALCPDCRHPFDTLQRTF